MPRNTDEEKFWNPYRWAPAASGPVGRQRPLYHHCWQGLCGRLSCTLTALTPFLIKNEQGSFISSNRTGKPFIPATSLKGNIRALAELIGNAAIPFPKVSIDKGHEHSNAAASDGQGVQLDVAARTFGYLDSKRVFAGLIRFSDGHPGEKPRTLPACTIAVGQPKPAHAAFYPGNQYRKLYHHRYAAELLTPPHAGIKQTSKVYPLAPGATFAFKVDFANLREEELELLLYCLVLEEDVSLTLSKEAVDAGDPVTIRGPLRHKLGYAKPHGGGSVHIQIEKAELRADPAARYRGQAGADRTLEGAELLGELERRTARFRERQDDTMRCLRAVLIYSSDDPRKPVNYPTYEWFNNYSRVGLKPTL